MTDFLYFVFVQQSAWWAGGISLYMTWMMGNKKWWAPFLGLLGQLFWLLLALFTAQHGLLITVVLYTIVHGRNALKWWREERCARAIRNAILNDPAAMEGIEAGLEDERAGRTVSLSDLRQRYGYRHP